MQVSVENTFTELLNQWRFIGTKRLQVLGSMPVGKHVGVAVLLHNCYCILYGMQASQMFGQELQAGLTLHSFLAKE